MSVLPRLLPQEHYTPQKKEPPSGHIFSSPVAAPEEYDSEDDGLDKFGKTHRLTTKIIGSLRSPIHYRLGDKLEDFSKDHPDLFKEAGIKGCDWDRTVAAARAERNKMKAERKGQRNE
jgi:hypothetical protein